MTNIRKRDKTYQTSRIVLIFTIVFALLLPLHNQLILASQFPDRGTQNIIDPYEYYTQQEKESLHKNITSLPNDYVVVILDEVETDGMTYTRDLFEHYELSTNSTLFVLTLAGNSQIFYGYGSELVEKGLTDDIINGKIDLIYQAYVNEKQYLTGVRSLINSIELELESLEAKRQREAEIVVNTPDQTNSEEETSKEANNMPWWVIGLSVLFIFMAAFMVFSFIYRRKVRKAVDKLENWKIQLENRPFSSQLARIKGLKMAGETEARFEKWKAQWEDILTTTLPEIEETLIDIEDYADQYRFIKSKQEMKLTEQRLQEIELALENIVKEIDELTSSEKSNKEKVVLLHEQYQELRSALQKNSMSLGIAYPIFYEKFKKTGHWFDQFSEAQENGDYLSANDLLEAIDDVFDQIKKGLQSIPDLIRTIENQIPAQLKEVEMAIAEMKEQGYLLEHTGIENRLKEAKIKQSTAISLMENGQIKELQAWVQQMNEEIEAQFKILENEVEAKKYVLSTIESIPQEYQVIRKQLHQVLDEVAVTKQSYTWEDDWEQKLEQINTGVTKIETLYKQLDLSPEDIKLKYPALKPILTNFHDEINERQV